jgi:hypothetical protein
VIPSNGGVLKIIVLYPEETLRIKTLTGQTKTLAGSVVQLLVNYCQLHVLRRAGQKFRPYTEGCPEFSSTFRTSHLFIPRFLAESVTTYRETLLGRHWSTNSLKLYFLQKLGHGAAKKVHMPVFSLGLAKFFVIVREVEYMRQLNCETRALV